MKKQTIHVIQNGMVESVNNRLVPLNKNKKRLENFYKIVRQKRFCSRLVWVIADLQYKEPTTSFNFNQREFTKFVFPSN